MVQRLKIQVLSLNSLLEGLLHTYKQPFHDTSRLFGVNFLNNIVLKDRELCKEGELCFLYIVLNSFSSEEEIKNGKISIRL